VQSTRARPNELAEETPLELRALLHFLNSRPIGYDPEALADPRAATAYLRASGFELVSGALDDDDLVALRQLRDALAIAVDHALGAAEHEHAWLAINAVAAASPVVTVFSAGPTAALEPTGRGVRRVIEMVLADLYAAITAGRFDRIKLCAFEPCAAAFYDVTRSRTQRWHSYATCGNRVNVAAHRERMQHTPS
jgi:predicted RNA-binding Zn ribbon-like protein